ncbi:MAG: hypothetical protein JSS94_03875 [Bacteroidetes bacterium]|nr:hypothetical protein [Bacteroidota bacterium]
MKKIYFALGLFFCFYNCFKKNVELTYPDSPYIEPKYDTTPVDSFSPGATSAEVARRIRMSSQNYQDSLKKALEKEAELKRQKALEEKLKKEVEKSIKMDEKPVDTSPEKQPKLSVD